jgi:protease I
MADELKGKRFAVLATDGFEPSELVEPCEELKRAGAIVDIVAPKSGRIQGMQHHEKGDTVAVDRTIDQVRSDTYAGLVLPGGVANPDALRLNAKVVSFVREFFETECGELIGAHGT